MRIIFVGFDLGVGGGNRAIFEVANRLKDRGYDVGIVALGGDHSWYDVKVFVKYVEINEVVKRRSVSKLVNGLIALYKLLRRHSNYKPDMLDFYGLLWRLGIRIYLDRIMHLAENLPDADVYIATWYPTALSVWLGSKDNSRRLFFMQDFPELVKEVDGEYGLRLFELVLRLPFTYVANSSFTRDLILRYNPSAKVYVSGVGVDTRVFYPRRDKVMDSKGRRSVMVILRGSQFKGDDVAVKVLNELNKRIPIMGLIVGSRFAVDKTFSLVKPEFPYQVFSDVSDDELARLYSSADLFLFTSYVESFGLPPLEAMACGAPVVMTDTLGNRDYAVNGVNSIVVGPGDVKALVDAAYQVLTDEKLRERLAQGGLETARKWNWDSVVDVFEIAIKGL